MTWGCQVLDWQQPDIMKKINNEPMSALTEQASEKNAQQGRKAKEIFLGIDVHVSRYLAASKLCGRLYSYLGGDRHALRIVRVPTPEQEQLRAQSRRYDQLMASRKAIAAQGRSLLLSQGYRIRGNWCRPRAYGPLMGLIPARVQESLETSRYDLKLLVSKIVEIRKRLSQRLPHDRANLLVPL